MQNVKKINDEIAVATNQLTPEDLQQAAQAGYRTVLNLRSPNEEGVLPEEQQYAEGAGLQYVNIPVKPDSLNQELADQVLQQIEQSPKPVLAHCKSGLRSGAMALIYVATREGISAEEAMQRGQQMGFDCSANPAMKKFFEEYVTTYFQRSQ